MKKNRVKLFNIFFGGACMLAVVIWFINYQIEGDKMGKEFYRDIISSEVVKSSSFYGRFVELYLEDGKRLYFTPPINGKIMIGDSIKKDANTYLYDVYRKQSNGEYEKWASYNMMDVN